LLFLLKKDTSQLKLNPMNTAVFSLNFAGSKRSLLISLLIPFLVVLSVFPVIRVNAQGNLVIIPRRVVFEGNSRSEDITLANGGVDSAKYQISIVQMRMKDDGSFETITTPDPGQNFADKYLRFYPRTVTLAPKQSQVIKMQLVKTDKLDPGEYRSHIYFRAVPTTKALAEAAPQDTSSFSASLSAIFGITIPVIIRIGEATGKVTLSNVAVNYVSDTLITCKMNFNRTGNTSVYGDVTVNYISPQGKVIKVSEVKGLAVYTPNTLRKFDSRLTKTAGVDYHKGKLHIVYSTIQGTRPTTLAEAEVTLK
jgi:hypothetical protein